MVYIIVAIIRKHSADSLVGVYSEFQVYFLIVCFLKNNWSTENLADFCMCKKACFKNNLVTKSNLFVSPLSWYVIGGMDSADKEKLRR